MFLKTIRNIEVGRLRYRNAGMVEQYYTRDMYAHYCFIFTKLFFLLWKSFEMRAESHVRKKETLCVLRPNHCKMHVRKLQKALSSLGREHSSKQVFYVMSEEIENEH